MRQLDLSRGKIAVVDDEDFDRLSHFRWWAMEPKPGRFYATTALNIDGKRKFILMHRMILSPRQDQLIDHKNGDGLDNRRTNLRICGFSGNSANSRRPGVKGTYKARNGKWAARIYSRGVKKYLGTFDSRNSAGLAYDAAARDIFGEFACPNFPASVA